MSELSIPCPECGASIELTEALAGPLLEAERRKAADAADAAERRFAADRSVIEEAAAAKARADSASTIAAMERAAEAKDAELAKGREAELAAIAARKEAEDARRNIDLEVARRVDEQAAVAADRAREQTAQLYEARLKSAESGRAEADAKLKAAEAAELAALKAKADAEEAQRQTELTVARRLDEDRGKVREQARRESSEEYRLQLAEKDATMRAMQETIEELRRKGAQGSQQLAGEVQEVDLLDVLSSAFPNDQFERTGKGQRGADVRQAVMGQGGVAGVILWEAKRTKLWSDTWLPKLREDQRAAKADVAVIATETLPGTVPHFDCVDSVWVSAFAYVVPLAQALRQRLLETARARRAAAGAEQKKDLAYDYVTGNDFRRRVAGILEPIVAMRDSLELERRTMEKLLSARAKHIERIGMNLVGLYGDFQGILGPSLPTVEGLALPEPAADETVDAPQLAARDAAGIEVH